MSILDVPHVFYLNVVELEAQNEGVVFKGLLKFVMPVSGCMVLDQMKMKEHHTSHPGKRRPYLFVSTFCIQVGPYVELNC